MGGYFFRADLQGISGSYSLFFNRFASEINDPVSGEVYTSPEPVAPEATGDVKKGA